MSLKICKCANYVCFKNEDLIALRQPQMLALLVLPNPPSLPFIFSAAYSLCEKKKSPSPQAKFRRIGLILIDILNLPFQPWGNPVSIKRYSITNKTSVLVDLSKNFKRSTMEIEEPLMEEHQWREDFDFFLETGYLGAIFTSAAGSCAWYCSMTSSCCCYIVTALYPCQY